VEVARDAKLGLIRHATTVVTVLGAAASTAWLDAPDHLQVHKQGRMFKFLIIKLA